MTSMEKKGEEREKDDDSSVIASLWTMEYGMDYECAAAAIFVLCSLCSIDIK